MEVKFNHKTIKKSHENFDAIKNDYVSREVKFTTDEDGGIKRESDIVDISVFTLEDLASHAQGEKLLAMMQDSIIKRVTDFKEAVVKGMEIPMLTCDFALKVLTTGGSSKVTFTKEQKAENAAYLATNHFSTDAEGNAMPAKVVEVIKTIFERGCTPTVLKSVGNRSFVEKIAAKLLEVAETETQENAVSYALRLAEQIDSYFQVLDADQQTLDGIQF